MRVGWRGCAQHVAAELRDIGDRLAVIDDGAPIGALMNVKCCRPDTDIRLAQRGEELVADVDVLLGACDIAKGRHALHCSGRSSSWPTHHHADLAVA